MYAVILLKWKFWTRLSHAWTNAVTQKFQKTWGNWYVLRAALLSPMLSQKWQNGLHWRGLLDVISFKLSEQKGASRARCSEPLSGGFWRSQSRETLQPLWASYGHSVTCLVLTCFLMFRWNLLCSIWISKLDLINTLPFVSLPFLDSLSFSEHQYTARNQSLLFQHSTWTNGTFPTSRSGKTNVLQDSTDSINPEP